jgi:DNA (cytosine-5)-methyltransferase 1
MTRTNEPKRSKGKVEEPEFTSIEICAGAGGQALGLHQAGFGHLALVEIDQYAAKTLQTNVESHPKWAWERENCDVLPPTDVNEFKREKHLQKSVELLERRELDLLAGGVPCPPFSHAGKQLGKADERDLFPAMLRLIDKLNPRAVMIENVRGIMDPKFEDYRDWIKARLQGGWYRGDDGQMAWEDGLGYKVCEWGILEASDFGVPQLRPRAILVAFRSDVLKDVKYEWPAATHDDHVSVAKALEKSMYARYEPYFEGARAERARAAYERWLDTAHKRHQELLEKGASGIAPTLVGGSKKHGGADLGPSRAKAAWKLLGVDALGVANDPETCRQKGTEDRDLFGPNGPMLTVQQAAIIQGFPPEWQFAGGKTAQYRQVGNAFPPPVAKAVGESIADVLRAARERDSGKA